MSRSVLFAIFYIFASLAVYCFDSGKLFPAFICILIGMGSYRLWRGLKNQSHEKTYNTYPVSQQKIEECAPAINHELENHVELFASKEGEYFLRTTAKYFSQEYMSVKDWLVSEQAFKRLDKHFACYNNDEVIKILESRGEKIYSLMARALCLSARKTREEHNKEATTLILTKWKNFFDSCESNPLTEAQRTACVVDEDSTLVIAGAGSGKTSTIISKAAYLVASGLAKPEEILLLAYNRDAADEMKARIEEKLVGNGDVEFKANTFHAFGLHLLREGGQENLDITQFEEQKLKFRAWLITRLNHHLEKKPEYLTLLLEYFSEFQVPVTKQTLMPPDELATRGLDFRTFGNEYVKSVGEVLIANFLYRNRVDYKYEADYTFPLEPQSRRYRPDFKVTYKVQKYDEEDPKKYKYVTKTLWIEYFGIDENGNTRPDIDKVKYKKSMEWKRHVHEKNGTTMLELTTADLMKFGKSGFLAKLQQLLCAENVSMKPMTKVEFLAALVEEEGRLHHKWEHFVDMVTAYLPLYTSLGFGYEEIRERALKAGFDVDRLDVFNQLFQPLDSDYVAYKKKNNLMDFSDMIERACKLLKSGAVRVPYKYILVDEFQDISHARAQLLLEILKQNNRAKLFAVGDDWQAIYRFSGSDLSFFTGFADYFENAVVLHLDRTYRFSNTLNDLTSAFVCRNPEQIEKHMKTHVQVSRPSAILRNVRLHLKDKVLPKIGYVNDDEKKGMKNPAVVASKATNATVVETEVCATNAKAKAEVQDDKDNASSEIFFLKSRDHYAFAIHYWLKKLAKKVAEREGKGNTVMLIGRKQWDKMEELEGIANLKELQEAYPTLAIEYSTAHSSKGLEADYVILVGLDARVFPNEQRNDEIIDSVLPLIESFPFAEERRLLYVAMTRAKKYLIMLYDGQAPSTFATELGQASSRVLTVNGGEVGYLCPSCMENQLQKFRSKSGEVFYRCQCGKLYSACKECGHPYVEVKGGKFCLNPKCDESQVTCPRCGVGSLKPRVNFIDQSRFFGCSMYGAADAVYSCTYTVNERRGKELIYRFDKTIAKLKRELVLDGQNRNGHFGKEDRVFPKNLHC